MFSIPVFVKNLLDENMLIILKKTMTIRPDDRYQTADDFMEALKKYLKHYNHKK